MPSTRQEKNVSRSGVRHSTHSAATRSFLLTLPRIHKACAAESVCVQVGLVLEQTGSRLGKKSSLCVVKLVDGGPAHSSRRIKVRFLSLPLLCPCAPAPAPATSLFHNLYHSSYRGCSFRLEMCCRALMDRRHWTKTSRRWYR